MLCEFFRVFGSKVETKYLIYFSWSKLRDLRFPRCLATLVNVHDRLYFCGGATRSYDVKSSVLCSVSAIDEYDVPGDEWFHVADMVIPRHDAGAAVAGMFL